MKNSIEALEWRYATKVYDPTKKLTDDQLNVLLESLRLAPSSYGLQAWKFIVVTNPEVRKQLRAVAWDQSQVTDASHLIVCAVPTTVDESLIDGYIDYVSQVRSVPKENLQGYESMMDGAIAHMTPEMRVEWVTRQVYLALGLMLGIAAIEGIDATPMEGFDQKKFDEILGLQEQGYTARVSVALGFRADSDTYAHEKKVRFPKDKVFTMVA